MTTPATSDHRVTARRLANGELYRIRRAALTDAQARVEFRKQIGAETEFLSFGAGDAYGTIESERAAIAASLTNPSSLVLVAEIVGDDGSPGGMVAMLDFTPGDRPRNRHTGTLGIAVVRSHWGLGIGRDLIETLIAWAERTGVIRKINLRVRPENVRAVALYASLGFVEEGRVSRDQMVGGAFHDNLIMGRAVDPVRDEATAIRPSRV